MNFAKIFLYNNNDLYDCLFNINFHYTTQQIQTEFIYIGEVMKYSFVTFLKKSNIETLSEKSIFYKIHVYVYCLPIVLIDRSTSFFLNPLHACFHNAILKQIENDQICNQMVEYYYCVYWLIINKYI